MVAKAAWLKVEPKINLREYLASEETHFLAPALDWMPDGWVTEAEDFEVHCGSDDAGESD